MLEFPAVAPPPEADEDDWFGEGNAFESGEDLAGALLAMAAHPEPAPAPVEQSPEPAVLTAPGVEGTFVLADPSGAVAPRRAAPAQPVQPAAQRSWSVRVAGAIPLPPRAPGRSGWSIRNSLMVLQHTEDVMNSLRQEAVAAALMAASRALRQES